MAKIIVPSGETSAGFELNGSMYVNENAAVSDVTVNRGAVLYISSGGSGSEIKENGGAVSYDAEATVSFVANTFSGASVSYSDITVHSGTTAVDTTLNASATLYVYNGGVANSVNASGNNWNAIVNVYKGGSASDVKISKLAYLQVYDGARASNVSVGSGTVYVYKGGAVGGLTAGRFAKINVSSGGSALEIKENGGAVWYDTEAQVSFVANTFSGAVASYSEITVHSGTTAVETTVNASGTLYVYNGGVANSVNASGNNWNAIVNVYKGGSASDVKISKLAYLQVYDGARASNVSVGSGTVYVYKGGAVGGLTAGRFAKINVSSGGSALEIKENGGAVWYDTEAQVSFVANTFSGAVASYSEITVHSGTTAVETTVNASGTLYVYNGGVANNVNASGNNWNAIVNVYKGGSASDVNISRLARLYVLGGAASNFVVGSNGQAIVSSGGWAVGGSVTSDGALYVSGGGVAADLVVSKGGCAYVGSNGWLTGKLELSGIVYAYSGGLVDFDISGLSTENTALINDLSLITGAPTFTVTVSDSQEFGTYTLAEGAASFTGYVAVINTVGDVLDWVDVGDTVNYADRDFTLSQNSGLLSFTVSQAEEKVPEVVSVSADITAPTNKNVTVTADYSTNTVTKQYSLDSQTWLAYTTGVTMSANGTVYFRGLSTSGKASEIVEYTGSNIDKTAPDAPTVTASNTKLTNRNVTVTAEFSEDSADKQYSTDGKTWKTYSAALTVSANGTYYFRGIDEAGNISDVTAYTVANIDKLMPTVKASTTAPTNKNVTVTATFPKDAAKKQYSTDKKTWQTYSKALSVAKNGTYYFRGVDKNGKASSVVTLKVANIDKTAPTAPKLKASTTKATNRNVTVTATFSSDSAKKQYSTDNKTWKTCSEALSVAKNGTYYFRGVDAAGNVSKVASIKVANIDKTAPAAPTVKVSTTKVTNKSITVTATFSADSAKKQYSTDNKTWKTYSKALAVKANGTYCFRGIDAAGNVSKVKSVKIANYVDTANNNWSGATVLKGTVSGALEAKADKVDYYNVSDVAQLMLDMEKGKAKVSFYDANKKAVKVAEVTMADGSVRKNVSALTLVTGNGTTDRFTVAALDDAVKYLKIETADKTLDSYKLAKLA